MKKETLNKVSLIIKTFERPDALNKLLKSIDKFYGKYKDSLNIYIADDSREPKEPNFKSKNKVHFFTLPFDSGLSKGRNFLVEKVKTKYFIILDDDFVFSRETKIESLVDSMEQNPEFDIVGGSVYNYRKHWWQKKRKIKGNRSVSLKNTILSRSKQPLRTVANHKIFHFILNFFIAKTDRIKIVKWNDNLKIVEHTAFFLDCMKHNFIVAEHPFVRINHLHLKKAHEFYNKYRVDRANKFIEYLHVNYHFTKDIEVDSL